MARLYENQHPHEIMGTGGNVVSLAAYMVKDIRTALLVLFAAVACVLLIP